MSEPPITTNETGPFGGVIGPVQEWRKRSDMLHREDGPSTVRPWQRISVLEWYVYGSPLCRVFIRHGVVVKEGC